MHLLYSDVLGTEVIDDVDHQLQGRVRNLLIDPDRGKIVALLVAVHGAKELFALQVNDIAQWGNRVHIREADVIGPASEVVRMETLLADPRTFIGQPIKTISGVSFGKCVDVQFETKMFSIEWIFPRKFFRRGLALPVSDILEVTPMAILVKDQGPRTEVLPVEDEEVPSAAPLPKIAGQTSLRTPEK